MESYRFEIRANRRETVILFERVLGSLFLVSNSAVTISANQKLDNLVNSKP